MRELIDIYHFLGSQAWSADGCTCTAPS